MKNYMVFRAIAPPSTDMSRIKDPIRYDTVTVVEANSEIDAVNAVIAATGNVSVGFAACEVTLHGFRSEQSLGASGQLRATSHVPGLNEGTA